MILVPHQVRCYSLDSPYLKEEVGEDLIEDLIEGDSVKVETMHSSKSVESFVNYQNEHDTTPLHYTTVNDQETSEGH